MLSTNFKRSVATLGVVAGLLAAAVPASAVGVSLDYPNDALTPLKATANWNGEDTPTETISFVKGPHQSVVVVTGEEDNVAGTQVGSEGVKAPTRADDQMYNPKEYAIDNLRGEAIDIIP
jgi:hypothetical protein